MEEKKSAKLGRKQGKTNVIAISSILVLLSVFVVEAAWPSG